ncbi:protein of unknown function (plasmid) [Cupriavidus taiwanensis]|uniref:Uncharacterized protein n=1 Tax=Cupriavidus taiwanensis TaxID=164546 RepID=A0A375IS43_9BURK|nr:hypothetical protein CT19425_U500040 [Cupriavidus taiwanensis]SPK76921.1 protein of unknown function [Cupriavidus taiwanensis]
MGHEHDGAAMLFLELQQHVLHFLALERIERGECLIHDHQRRVDRKRPRKADTLLHATRQFARQLLRKRREADLFEHIHRPALTLLPADAGDLEPERRVRQHRALRHQRERLEHHAHVLAAQRDQFRSAHGGHVAATDQHLAGCRLDEPVHETDQCRLAGAGQAHQHEDLAFPDVERYVVHTDDLAGAPEHLVLRRTGGEHVERLLRIASKYLAQTFDHDLWTIHRNLLLVLRGLIRHMACLRLPLNEMRWRCFATSFLECVGKFDPSHHKRTRCDHLHSCQKMPPSADEFRHVLAQMRHRHSWRPIVRAGLSSSDAEWTDCDPLARRRCRHRHWTAPSALARRYQPRGASVLSSLPPILLYFAHGTRERTTRTAGHTTPTKESNGHPAPPPTIRAYAVVPERARPGGRGRGPARAPPLLHRRTDRLR